MVIIMELKKYKNRNKRNLYVLITIGFLLLTIGSYLFYQSYALYEEEKNFNIINGTVEDPGDIYFAYYVDDKITTSVPLKDDGYYLEEKSSCTNDVTISWNQQDWIANLDFGSYNKENNSRVKCTLYFSNIKYDETTLYDLSGNHYNGTFQNGAKVISDTEGEKAIYFDGTDDFVDIKDIPNIYDWNSGFTVEFEATWYAFNYVSRIFDFSNNNNNEYVIFLANSLSTSDISMGGRNGKDDTSHYTDTVFKNKISLSQKQNFMFKRIKNNYENDLCTTFLIKNNTYEDRVENKNCSGNTAYTNNYLGKSAWKQDGYFNGLIYNLKITDANGKVIVWYDVN